MLNTVLVIAVALVSLALLLTLWRLFRGPSLPDRILALDTLYVNAIALLVLFGLLQKQATRNQRIQCLRDLDAWLGDAVARIGNRLARGDKSIEHFSDTGGGFFLLQHSPRARHMGSGHGSARINCVLTIHDRRADGRARSEHIQKRH